MTPLLVIEFFILFIISNKIQIIYKFFYTIYIRDDAIICSVRRVKI